MAALRIRNGVDRALLEQMSEGGDQSLMSWTPDAAVETEWRGSVESRSRVERDGASGAGFAIVTDQPPTRLGNDAGPRPEELVLAAIGAKFVETYALRATLCGITIESLCVGTRLHSADGVSADIEMEASVVADADDTLLHQISEQAYAAAGSMCQAASRIRFAMRAQGSS